MVRAYKGVLTEKDALEATVKALSISQEDDADSALPGEGDRPSDNETDYETLKSSTGDCVRSEGVRSDMSETGDSGAETKQNHLSPSGMYHQSISSNLMLRLFLIGGFRHQLKQQLSTVTAAMATLNAEKAKMESSFQEDKKAMLVRCDGSVCCGQCVCVCVCVCRPSKTHCPSYYKPRERVSRERVKSFGGK